MSYDLSILIPSRNEAFLLNTINDILANRRAKTEIIVVLDGSWPLEPIPDHPDVTLIYHPESIGQRAACNEAARVSTAKYVMKLDAHTSVAPGFDVALINASQPDLTQIPRMYNLHVFNMVCVKCQTKYYQGHIDPCQKCGGVHFEQELVWKPRMTKRTDFARFDHEMKFQYWRDYEKRPEAQGDLSDVMCFVGACFFMERVRYWELEGLDENHGGWGQMGVEISCKSHLSGGRMVVNKRTSFSHLFRTQPGLGFPYPITGTDQKRAREYSRDLWMNNKWSKQVHPLSWLIEKFSPVPEWENEKIKGVKQIAKMFHVKHYSSEKQKAVIYYTDNRLSPEIMTACQRQIEQSINGHELVSVSLAPLEFGRNLTLDRERGYLTMFQQILAGLEASTADVIFLAEHDCLYSPSHFQFIPPDPAKIYYNQNVWHLRVSDGHAVYYEAKRLSQLCAYRDVLLEHYRKRVAVVEEKGFSRKIGFEPGSHRRAERIDDLQSEYWRSEFPNLDLKHGQNLTPARWSPEQFRDQRNCRGWLESDDTIPGWGATRELIARLNETQ